MSYLRFFGAINGDDYAAGPPYSDEKLKPLYDALRADPEADIEQLSCEVCGLPQWRDHETIVVDRAEEAAESAGIIGDQDHLLAWYIDHHSCRDNLPIVFMPPISGGWEQREKHEQMMEAIEAALEAPLDPPEEVSP